MTTRKNFRTLPYIRSMVVFAMLGTLMFVSKMWLEFLPNVHMIALFTCVFTIVYRAKALIPLYIFVFLTGLFNGFNLWWIPYLYIWTVLWAVTMLFPKRMAAGKAVLLCSVCTALHGLAYGTLYSPTQALIFHYTVPQTLAWIAAGLPWDAVHAAGNLAFSFLAVPLIKILEKLEKKTILLPSSS